MKDATKTPFALEVAVSPAESRCLNGAPRGPELHYFIDWRCWTVGIEFPRSPSRDDRLGQYHDVIAAIGPLVFVVRWAR